MSATAPLPDYPAAGAASWCELNEFAVLDFHGEDAPSFLQGQLSSDVREVSEQHAQYSSYSTAKGRMLASFLIWRRDEHYRLLVSADLAEAMKKRLGMFILRAKVKHAIDADTVLLGVQGEAGALAAALGVALPQEVGAVAQAAGGSVLALAGGRCLLALSADAAPAVRAALVEAGLTQTTSAAWRAADIAHGLPWISVATQEMFVPQMANMELIGAVNFKKGCYPGQEIVARSQYLGKVKRRMFRVRIADPAAAPGAELFSPASGEQVIGNLVNVAPVDGGVEALAVFQLPALEAGVHLGSLSGPRLEVLTLPYSVE